MKKMTVSNGIGKYESSSAPKRAGRTTGMTLGPSRRSGEIRRAFTLVELLVVIGIIAVLIGVLMPALQRARESANQTKCLSNVRQLSSAFIQYTDGNKGRFPFRGGFRRASSEDWVYWQNGPVAATVAPPADSGITAYTGRSQDDFDNANQGGVMRYLASTPGRLNMTALICPSDDLEQRRQMQIGGLYPLSYTFNARLSGDSRSNPRMSAVKRSSDVIMVVEESENTANDGVWDPSMYDDQGNYITGTGALDLISIIHDRRRATDDTGYNPLNNPERKGNVAFVDGHAEFMQRVEAHRARRVNPKLTF